MTLEKYSFSVFIPESKRVDMYLSALFGDFSRSYVQKMIDRGQVHINKKQIKKNIKIHNKDEVSLIIKLDSLDIQAEDMKLDIVYEDSNFLVVNKDAGVNVHPVPGENGHTGTLVNGILYHCRSKLPSIGGVERPGIVHRIDKDTSGLLLVAKSDSMMKYLAKQIKDRNVDKYYLAVVYGKVKDKKFKIESSIGRDKNDRKKMTTNNPINPKNAVSFGELIDYIDDKYSLILVKIETGRTHQIRVQLASIGYPIIGDNVYGIEKENKIAEEVYSLQRQALHAYALQLDLYGKQKKFVGEIKKDMKKIIGKSIMKLGNTFSNY